MNKSWFRRLLLSYLPAFFGITMLLFFLFFQSLNEQNRKEAARANEFLAQQAILFTDNALKTIDYSVVREILTDPAVTKFFSLDENDVYANIQALKVMDNLKAAYPMIDSVYFVRAGDLFLLGSAPKEMNDFPDKTFIEPYLNGALPERWTGVRMFKTIPDGTGKPVVTLVRSAPYFTGQKRGLFVVNVSVAGLQNAVRQMYNPGISFVRLIDADGQTVLGGGTDAKGRNPVFSAYTSPYTGWKVESGLLHQDGLAFTLHLYNLWTLLAVATVAAGILWFIHVTRKNCKPIQQIVSLIRTGSPGELLAREADGGGRNTGELGFIQHTLERLMEQTEQFRKQHQQDLILLKKVLFQELLEGTRPNGQEDCEAELAKLGYEVKGRIPFVQVLEIDGYRLFTNAYSPHDQRLLKFTLYIVLHETAQQHHADVWAEWTADNRLTAILWERDSAASGAARNAIMEAVREWTEQNLKFTVTIGMPGEASGLRGIRGAYENALQLLQFKAVLGPNRVIAPGHTAGRTQAETNEWAYTACSLAQTLRLCGSEWPGQLGLLFAQIRDALTPRSEIDGMLQFLCRHLEREFAELSKEYRRIWKTAQAELQALQKHWETAGELEDGCRRIFAAMASQMDELKDSYGARAIVTEIRKFIIGNYANPDLSLDFLSDKFQLNAKQVSKMFKEEFGENFVDFLIGIRMSRAKELLAETQKSMQQISLEVGYYNYNSFNRAFKNTVGLSPRDFRKQGSQSA
ncbi:AraC family transcriptional regulator [Paenibacillus humicola]|uniref:AraC family transcriptional regulator n=1 Tax=Paenibacillus humicola TaxID=3110540 RepID=UPI00237A68CA|nr:AraC family transcriptional regulator [Paenibacillus humicola]